MTALWTAQEAMAATGGTTSGDWSVSGVSIDSRTIAAGDLFVAIVGPNVDGHKYVAGALNTGSAAMIHAPVEGADATRLLTVPDTYQGLLDLAAAARDRAGAKVVAVTGSVGKTGVKEMLRLVLGAQGATHANLGNLNNQWGLPLTLARMPRETEFAVLEMGMSEAGELTPLAQLARPDVAIVTAVELAHAEFFDSAADIAEAKAEIFTGLKDGGVAIINRDSDHFVRLASHAKKHGATVVGFGAHEDAEARLISLKMDGEDCRIAASINGQAITYTLGVTGRHWALNSLAVLAAVDALGGDVIRAARSLVGMAPPKGRGERHTVTLPGGGEITVVDESYNASPASVRAALATLAMIPVTAPQGRRIAVLGDMLELGTDGARLHGDLAEAVAINAIDLVFTAGPLMETLFDRIDAARRGGHGAESQAIASMVVEGVRDGDVVMIKGSAGSKMAVVLDALLALDAHKAEEN